MTINPKRLEVAAYVCAVGFLGVLLAQRLFPAKDGMTGDSRRSSW